MNTPENRYSHLENTSKGLPIKPFAVAVLSLVTVTGAFAQEKVEKALGKSIDPKEDFVDPDAQWEGDVEEKGTPLSQKEYKSQDVTLEAKETKGDGSVLTIRIGKDIKIDSHTLSLEESIQKITERYNKWIASEDFKQEAIFLKEQRKACEKLKAELVLLKKAEKEDLDKITSLEEQIETIEIVLEESEGAQSLEEEIEELKKDFSPETITRLFTQKNGKWEEWKELDGIFRVPSLKELRAEKDWEKRIKPLVVDMVKVLQQGDFVEIVEGPSFVGTLLRLDDKSITLLPEDMSIEGQGKKRVLLKDVRKAMEEVIGEGNPNFELNNPEIIAYYHVHGLLFALPEDYQGRIPKQWKHFIQETSQMLEMFEPPIEDEPFKEVPGPIVAS